MSTNSDGPAENGTDAENLNQDHVSAFSEFQISELVKRGISVEAAVAAGVRSITSADQLPEGCPDYWSAMLPAMILPWRHGDVVEWQIMPDDRERFSKYLFRDGAKIPLNQLRDTGFGPVLIIEGFWQALAASQHDRSAGAIYAMAGVDGWTHADLSPTIGRPVTVIPDGDLRTNRDVYDAVAALIETLDVTGAGSTSVASLPARPKSQGLDDLLARQPEPERANVLTRVLAGAKTELGRPPAKRKKTGPAGAYFNDGGSLLVNTLAEAIFERHPSALTAENSIALYAGGAYRVDQAVFLGAVAELLGEENRPSHRAAAQEHTIGTLARAGRRLPEWVSEPLLNVRNGLLDLRTGGLIEHSPDFLSSNQVPVEWDPEATCPLYEAWVESLIPGQIEAIEEVAAQMLDQSRTPSKTLLAYGPPRSGKSTFLRILEHLAGPENRSAASLHQLVENKFMAANVYGMMLNTSADLSASHIEDLNIFKMMTGDDSIQADRKYGKQFTFRSRALFAFSAYELPTVGDSSGAYRERIKPFKFGNSFAGREDQSVEDKIIEHELPGILVRFVRARQRWIAHGGQWLATPAEVQAEFETRSDRVRQWVAECCTVHADIESNTVPESQFRTKRLAQRFNFWAERNSGADGRAEDHRPADDHRRCPRGPP